MLEIRQLRVVYPGGREALRDVSLTVGRGEVVALIGRSGAGKSTLLRCSNGLQRPSSGQVLVDGVDLTQLSAADVRRIRTRIGFIWQEFNVVQRLSAFTNVLTGRLGHRPGLRSLAHWFDRGERAIALRSLERVQLAHLARQRADRLSGGEKQRVAIARALAQEPHLLLADEPVASLDVALSGAIMRDLVRLAREERVPTLISLHDVGLAKACADRVVGLAGGAAVFDGPPGALGDEALRRIYQGGISGESQAASWPDAAAVAESR